MKLARNPEELKRIFGNNYNGSLRKQLFALQHRIEIEKDNDFTPFDFYKNQSIINKLEQSEKLKKKERQQKKLLTEKVKAMMDQQQQESVDAQHLALAGISQKMNDWSQLRTF